MAPLGSPWVSLGSPLGPPWVPLGLPWVPLGLPLGPLGSPLGVLGSPLAPLGSPLWLPSGPPFCSSSRRAHSAHNVGALLLLVISARVSARHLGARLLFIISACPLYYVIFPHSMMYIHVGVFFILSCSVAISSRVWCAILSMIACTMPLS